MLESPEWVARVVASKAPRVQPRVGIVFGSGLGPLGDQIQNPTRIPYADLPGFPVSRVPGHSGNLILGDLCDTSVVAMQGRAHLYEGWSLEQATFPIRTMIAMGIRLLIVSNASGGINLRFRSGEIVLIDRHINNMFRSGPIPPLPSAEVAQWGVPARTRDAYSPLWLERANQCAIELGFHLPRGTYLATLGPNYETRAEYRAFARMGADMVGMSTVPEVLVAAQYGIDVLAFSIVTNVANPDRPSKTDHAEVLDWSTSAQQRLLPLLGKLLSQNAHLWPH
jgi:purine-nucleoside phosphorylase